MKEVIVLRHADRDGDTLTDEGIQACRELATRIGQLDVVIASQTGRTQQTAMLVSEQHPVVDARANIPFTDTAPMFDLIQETLHTLPDNGRALIVTHGPLLGELKNTLHTQGFGANFYGFRELDGMVVNQDLLAQPLK